MSEEQNGSHSSPASDDPTRHAANGELKDEEFKEVLFMKSNVIDKRINDAVQAALQTQMSAFMNLMSNQQMSRNIRFPQPNFTLPDYTKEEKLSGNSNYQTWNAKLETGLQSQNLLIYIQKENGDPEETEEVRKVRE